MNNKLALTIALVGCGLCQSAAAFQAPDALYDVMDDDVLDNMSFRVGYAINQHSIKRAELSQRLTLSEAQLIQYDNRSDGGEIGIAYHFSPQWYSVLGYRDYGNLDNQWAFSSLDVVADLQNVQATMPVIGNGVFAGIGYRRDIVENVFVDAVVELQRWEQTLSTTIEEQSLRTTRSGTEVGYGIGVGYRISPQWSVSLLAKHMPFADESVNSLALLAEYRFADSQHSTVSVPRVQAAIPDNRVAQVSEALTADEPQTKALQGKTIAPLERPVSVYFDYDSTQLSRNVTSQLLSLLAQRSINNIVLIGMADGVNQNNNQYNQALAYQRADVVQQLLVSLGVEPSLISITTQVKSSVDRYSRRVDIRIDEE